MTMMKKQRKRLEAMVAEEALTTIQAFKSDNGELVRIPVELDRVLFATRVFLDLLMIPHGEGE